MRVARSSSSARPRMPLAWFYSSSNLPSLAWPLPFRIPMTLLKFLRTSEAGCLSGSHPSRGNFRFSLLTLLSIVSLAAIYCTLVLHVPHLVVFVGVATATVWLTVRMIRQKLSQQKIHWRLLTATVFAWGLMYVVSFGPAAVSIRNYDDPQLQTVRTMYAPVIWLHNNTPLQGPLEIYVRMWAKWWMGGGINIFRV